MEIYQHNKEAYKNVKEAFKTANRTCVVQPMGCGKSYVALQWIQENLDKKILYLTSNSSIKRQISNLLETEIQAINVDIFTYSGVLKQDISGYDMIVLDEFHRVGAEKWGAAVKKILECCPNAQVLGLSATPIRYLDNKRDMSEELFHGNIAWEMTLAQAIVQGILPAPKYVTCLYSMQEEYNNAVRKANEIKSDKRRAEAYRLLERAKSYLEQSRGLEEVFREHITDKSGRYIVFCKDIDHMNKMINESKGWFKGVNKNVNSYIAVSDMGKRAFLQEITSFENDNSKALKLLFCVNMFNEGYHLSDISGVVLLRPTESPNIYLQQIGRGLRASGKGQPLVIDVVGNIKCLNESMGLESEINTLINAESSEFVTEFKVISAMQDFISILNDVDFLSKYTFFDWIELCKEFKKEYGHLNICKAILPDGRYKGMAICNWLSRTRSLNNKGELPEKYKQLCEEIGLDLSLHFEVKDWDIMYDYCLEYMKVNNKLFVQSNDMYKGIPIGKWATSQLDLHRDGKLSTEQSEKLSNIIEKDRFLASGGNDYHNIKWLSMYNNVLSIGVSNLKTNTKEYTWVCSQTRRLREGKLSPEKAELIAKLGFMTETEKYWYKRYGYLVRIYEVEGCVVNALLYKNDPDFRVVRNFIKSNRDLYNNGKLPKWQIDLLNKINFKWDAEFEKYSKLKVLLEEYFRVYSTDKLVQGTVYKGENIGSAFYYLYKKYTDKTLSEKYVEMFKDLIKEWELSVKSKDLAWEKSYALVVEYIQVYKVLPIATTVYKGSNIGIWVTWQRDSYKKGTLSKYKVEKLRDIGIIPEADGHFRVYVCTTADVRWNKRLADYVNFKTGVVKFSSRERESILNWERRQRSEFVSGSLSEYRIYRLKEVGFDFRT